MVLLGLAPGIATGGLPAYAKEVSTAALVLAMTFSLTEVRFRGMSFRADVGSVARALTWIATIVERLAQVHRFLAAPPIATGAAMGELPAHGKPRRSARGDHRSHPLRARGLDRGAHPRDDRLPHGGPVPRPVRTCGGRRVRTRVPLELRRPVG